MLTLKYIFSNFHKSKLLLWLDVQWNLELAYIICNDAKSEWQKDQQAVTYVLQFYNIVLNTFLCITLLVMLPWRQLKGGFKYCCAKTSLHGFQYIMNPKLAFCTRFFFTAVCLASIVFCFYLSKLQLYEYNENPVMTSLTTTAYPVWKVPFPSVTICNFNIVYKNTMLKMAKML